MRQEEKEFLNLAGEFAVASELNRRQVLASVTYGASKRADLFALSSDMSRFVRIEVKATTPKGKRTKWAVGVGGTKDIPIDVFWVLVLFPSTLDGAPADSLQLAAQAPRFYVLSQKEVYLEFRKAADEYDRRKGAPFTGRGFPSVFLKDVEPYEGQWQKIIKLLGNSK